MRLPTDRTEELKYNEEEYSNSLILVDKADKDLVLKFNHLEKHLNTYMDAATIADFPSIYGDLRHLNIILKTNREQICYRVRHLLRSISDYPRDTETCGYEFSVEPLLGKLSHYTYEGLYVYYYDLPGYRDYFSYVNISLPDLISKVESKVRFFDEKVNYKVYAANHLPLDSHIQYNSDRSSFNHEIYLELKEEVLRFYFEKFYQNITSSKEELTIELVYGLSICGKDVSKAILEWKWIDNSEYNIYPNLATLTKCKLNFSTKQITLITDQLFEFPTIPQVASLCCGSINLDNLDNKQAISILRHLISPKNSTTNKLCKEHDEFKKIFTVALFGDF